MAPVSPNNNVTEIRLVPEPFKLRIAKDPSIPHPTRKHLDGDKDEDNNPLLENGDPKIPYKCQQTAYSPTACVLDLTQGDPVLLEVDVRGPSNQKGATLSIGVGLADPETRWKGWKDDIHTYEVILKRKNQGPYKIGGPCAVSIQHNGEVKNLGEVPLEIFVLPFPPQKYFSESNDDSGGVPLLLLRLFVTPASSRDGPGPEKWVDLVTKIAHGSLEPITGFRKETKEHWLKYETANGQNSFIGSGWADPTWPFHLIPWLDAYRNFSQRRVYTTVNCYDQAAIVEVALSLGMNPDWVFWEYHSPFGFITTTELVGWGDCNNPYFAKKHDISKKTVGATYEDRTWFSNHAHLSWSSTAKPSAIENTEPDADAPIFIIDACAGPHTGNESRKDYDKGKDKEHRSLTEDEKNTKVKHLWNHGITTLSDVDKSGHIETLLGTYEGNPIFKDESSITPPGSSENPACASFWGGDIAELTDQYVQIVRSRASLTDAAVDVYIPDQLYHTMTTIERKLYKGQKEVDFFSLKVTVTTNKSRAKSQLQGRATFVDFCAPAGAEKVALITTDSSRKHLQNVHIAGGNGWIGFIFADLVIELHHRGCDLNELPSVAEQITEYLVAHVTGNSNEYAETTSQYESYNKASLATWRKTYS